MSSTDLPPPIPPRKKTHNTFASADESAQDSAPVEVDAGFDLIEEPAAAAPLVPPPMPRLAPPPGAVADAVDWSKRPSTRPFFGAVPTPAPPGFEAAVSAPAPQAPPPIAPAPAAPPAPPRPKEPEQPTVVLGPAAKQEEPEIPIEVDEEPLAAGGAGVIAGEHSVVLHTLTGPLKRGTLRNPNLDSEQLDLIVPGGGVEHLAVDRVKAIFFMLAPGQKSPKPTGKRVTVNTADGRQLFGYREDGRESDRGFFMIPADKTQAARIFVFQKAVKSVIEK
jgi:hypothetical protein